MIDQDAADLYERLRITLDRADGGRVKIADEIEYVLAETSLISGRVPGFEDSAVNAATQMFDK